MIRFYLLLAALLIVRTSVAQTGKYYIEDREVTKEEILAVSRDRIESMNNTVEDGLPVVRIKLKADTLSVTAWAQEEIKRIHEETTLLKAGDAAAGFTAKKMNGEPVSLEQLRGKVILLNFWATWCAPCLRELAPEALPEFILKRFAENTDFIFLPVAYTDSEESLEKFFQADKSGNYTYLRSYAVPDPDKTIFSKYATQGVPRSFVIDRDGTIRYGSLGSDSDELQNIAQAIEEVLQNN